MRYFIEKITLIRDGDNGNRSYSFDCELYTDNIDSFRYAISRKYTANKVLLNYQEIPKGKGEAKKIKSLYENEIE